MSFKSYCYYATIVLFFFSSCAPSFDLEKEQIQIKNTVFSESDFKKRIDIFYANSPKKDSLKQVITENEHLLNSLLDELKKDPIQSSITINEVSSTITIQDRLFRIVNVTESFTIDKKELEIAYEDFETHIKSNLYEFTVDATQYTVTGNTNFIAIYHKNAWEYFNFNVSLLYDAYGLEDSKKIVQLYYDEIFKPAEEKWDAESIKDFKEIYSENKNLPQHKDRDFDAYCDCLIKHAEKLDLEEKYEYSYFESYTYNNIIYMCRILTTYE